MTPREVVQNLARAFAVLSPSELENLRYHRDHSSRVLCGLYADRYVYEGAG